MASIIQLRRDTAANWTSANPTLAQGELGLETDTLKIKAGDGSTTWTSLGYLIDTGGYVTLTGTQTLTNKTINAVSLQEANKNVVTEADIGTAPNEVPINQYLGSLAYQNKESVIIDRLKLNESITEKKVVIAASNIDLALGNYFTKTITENITFSLNNISTTNSVSTFILELVNGGAYQVNWFANVRWPGGTAPTLTASGKDVLAFFTHDAGSNWNSFVLGLDVK